MDLAMDLVILAAVQLSFARFRPLRLLAAQALLSSVTLLALSLGREAATLLHAPVMLLCAAAVTGETGSRRILQAALCILACSAVGAGLCMLLGHWAGFLGILALTMLMRGRRHPATRWNIEIEMELDGATARFPALMDTGNRLREHGSGLPVLIVEEGAARQIADRAALLSPDRLRTMPFGVLGSGGEISCFRPDGVHILLPGLGRVRAPDCWAAVYHGRIPGSTRALAPPEFIDAIEQATYNQGIQDRARRIFYGFFKCKAIHLRAGGADSQGFGLLHRRQRPAAPAIDPRGRGGHGAQGARRRYAGPLHHDRAQPAAGGVHRPQI